MPKTLGKQFTEMLNPGVSGHDLESFITKYSVSVGICISNRKCGWVCYNVIFADGSVYGYSQLSEVSLRVRGFSANRDECREYSDRFATKF